MPIPIPTHLVLPSTEGMQLRRLCCRCSHLPLTIDTFSEPWCHEHRLDLGHLARILHTTSQKKVSELPFQRELLLEGPWEQMGMLSYRVVINFLPEPIEMLILMLLNKEAASTLPPLTSMREGEHGRWMPET